MQIRHTAESALSTKANSSVHSSWNLRYSSSLFLFAIFFVEGLVLRKWERGRCWANWGVVNSESGWPAHGLIYSRGAERHWSRLISLRVSAAHVTEGTKIWSFSNSNFIWESHMRSSKEPHLAREPTFPTPWRITLHKDGNPFPSVCSRWVALFIFFPESFVYVLVTVAEYFKFQLLVNRCWFRSCGYTALVLISQILIVGFVCWRLICVSFDIAI